MNENVARVREVHRREIVEFKWPEVVQPLRRRLAERRNDRTCNDIGSASLLCLKERGEAKGLRHVESGPLVRSSYHAEKQVRAHAGA